MRNTILFTCPEGAVLVDTDTGEALTDRLMPLPDTDVPAPLRSLVRRYRVKPAADDPVSQALAEPTDAKPTKRGKK